MNFEIPANFRTALAMNTEAMYKFKSLSEAEKWQIVSGTHAVDSKEDMKKYVENIITAY